MGRIVAIGGGSIGFEGPPQTTKIDKEIIRLTKKKKPRLLFIPTASGDAPGYVDIVHKHFGKRLGCVVDELLLTKKPTKKLIREKILWADIIYVGGGNTLRMMNAWRRLGVDKLLRQAHKKGTVLCGLSAGANCWFTLSNSDSLSFTSKTKKLIRVTGLGLHDLLFCPHYDGEKRRRPGLEKMMKKTSRVAAIACDNCTALEIVDDKWRILSTKRGANAYKVYWRRKKYYEERLPANKWFPLEALKKDFSTEK